MGTWISHLRIAENLLAALPGLDPLPFSLGSLAPDSGVPNADWSAFDPPKTVTHFLQPGEDEGRIADLEFYRSYLRDLSPDAEPARYSFRLAYFFHLISDNLWAYWVNLQARVEFADLIAALGVEAWWKMKEDWYDLDHQYLRDHRDSLFWRLIWKAAPLPAMLDFLPDLAVQHQFVHIQQFYGEPAPRELDRPYPYLNAATMDRYVVDTTSALLEIHATLIASPISVIGRTALQFLPPAKLARYPSPLGDAL
jgi:hypothetical protein